MANIQGIIEKVCVYAYLNFYALPGWSLPGEKNKYELNQLFSLNLKKTYLFEWKKY